MILKTLDYKLKKPTQANFIKMEFLKKSPLISDEFQEKVREPDLMKREALVTTAEGIDKL